MSPTNWFARPRFIAPRCTYLDDALSTGIDAFSDSRDALRRGGSSFCKDLVVRDLALALHLLGIDVQVGVAVADAELAASHVAGAGNGGATGTSCA